MVKRKKHGFFGPLAGVAENIVRRRVGQQLQRIAHDVDNMAVDDGNDVLESTKPTQEIPIKKSKLSKRKKTELKRKIKFEKKVKKALSNDVLFGTWIERCTAPINVNWSGAVGQTDYQEVVAGTNGQLMLHHDVSNGAGISTYPLQALSLLSASATDTALVTTNAGTRPRKEPMKIRTTHAEFGMEILNAYASSPLILDIYTFVAKDDMGLGWRPYDVWSNLQSNAVTGAGQIQFSTAAYATQPTLNTRYMTPLDVPEFGKYWSLQDKDRIIIAPSTKIQWRMKNARRPTFSALDDNNSAIFKGKTQGVLIVAYPLGDTTIPLATNILKIFPYKKYHYKRIDTLSGNAGINLAHSTTIAV